MCEFLSEQKWAVQLKSVTVFSGGGIREGQDYGFFKNPVNKILIDLKPGGDAALAAQKLADRNILPPPAAVATQEPINNSTRPALYLYAPESNKPSI